MKTSALIKLLQKNLDENGDLDINLWDDDMEEVGEFGGISTAMNDKGEAVAITLCGPETLLAFSSEASEEDDDEEGAA